MSFRQPFKMDWPITQNYGETLTSSFHTGIDYGCPTGTEILASSDGMVMFAAFDTTGYGNCVIIQHSGEKTTLYAHLSDISVKKGTVVSQGQLIGHSGSTGNSTGPHLHFEARTQWDKYQTHFNPILLPLMTVIDKAESDLKGASELIGPVKIVAPSGAYAHNEAFTAKTVLPYGTKLVFTGITIERNGFTFCECNLPAEPFWVAVNDGETQILDNDR